MMIRAIGSIASGGAHAASFAEVKMNSVFTPLNTATPPPNLLGGNTTSSNPSGYAELVGTNGPYTDFRVLGSAVSFELLIETAADNMLITVAPFLSTALPTTVLGTATAMGGVSRMVGFAQGSRNIIKTKVSTAVVAGATDEEAAVTSTLLGNPTTDPSSLYVWSFAYCLGVNQVTTAAVTYSMCVSYDVVLESPQWKALADGGDDEKVYLPKGNSASEKQSVCRSTMAVAALGKAVAADGSDEQKRQVKSVKPEGVSKSCSDEEWTATGQPGGAVILDKSPMVMVLTGTSSSSSSCSSASKGGSGASCAVT